MKKPMNSLILCLILTIAWVMIAPRVAAQFLGSGTIWQFPAFSSQPLQVTTWEDPFKGEGDILIDNFEYWDSPYNHGWRQAEPAYPVYGFGMGYATIFNTVLDLQEGSRVLDVYRPPSIFLLSTPYEKHFITRFLFTPPTASNTSGSPGINLDPNDSNASNAVVSFKFRAPLGIEPWDIFEFHIHGNTLGNDGKAGTDDDRDFLIQIRPVQPPFGSGLGGGSSTANMGGYRATLIQAGSSASPMLIQVDIGRNFLDGSWHTVWIDLNEMNRNAHDGSVPAGWELATATLIMAGGQMFRMDDIIFRAKDYKKMDQPDFFEIGPLYAQIFEPYRYLFMADYQADSDIPHMGRRQMITDLMLDAANFITDPEEIREAWASDLLALDPNYHVIDPNHAQYDPNYTNRWEPGDPNHGTPDPVAEIYLREGFVIDSTLPVFSDPDLRIAGSRVADLRAHGTLGWNVTVNGYGANAIQAFLIQPLPIYPYDGMPTYIPAFYSAIAAIKAHGKHHYGPHLCFMLESALWNSGVERWPNIAYMDYTPQYFEDLIVTIEVSDGKREDVRTIPISVVNYPVENYAPVVQLNVSPFIFYVGQYNEYLIKFVDPDCYIFSLAHLQGGVPATSHVPGWPINDWSQIRRDQDALFYRMTLDGMISYQYGPWIEDMIDPLSGLISFTPKFEGLYRVVISSTDDRGTIGMGAFRLLCVNRGTWLNHPPFITSKPNFPVVVRAGEEVVIVSPDFIVTDPDGDQMYATCNIGSVGQTADGGFMWTFQTNFPGAYMVEIIWYDIRGGYAIMRLPVEVKPWWSY